MRNRAFLVSLLGISLPLALVGATLYGCGGDDANPSTEPSPDGATPDDPKDGSSPSDPGKDGSSPGDPSSDAGGDAGPPLLPEACRGTKASPFTAGPAPTPTDGLNVPSGFAIERIASVPGARQLATLPNGDLLVATNGKSIYLISNAEAEGAVGKPTVFATIDDEPVQGITFDGPSCTIFVGTMRGVHAIPYQDGEDKASSIKKIATLRDGQGIDGEGHRTTSVVVAGDKLYAAAGSSCNACKEKDPTRAAIQEMNKDGSGMKVKATRIRNAIALATNPDTGTVWAGNAGQDQLPKDRPYEFFDAVTLHDGVADYGWPVCEENQKDYGSGADCSKTVVPRVVLPAYSTLIGAVFYPASRTGAHAFPAAQRGAFVTARGSWHKTGPNFSTPPRVAFVAMDGDTPKTPVDWSDPNKQWTEFVGGFQPTGTSRVGRPTGIAIGTEGSLLVADDHIGVIYRVRPQ